MTLDELNNTADCVNALIVEELESSGIEHSEDYDDIPGVVVFDNPFLVDLYKLRIELRERIIRAERGR